MPSGAQILCLQTQGDMPHLWALCDPDAHNVVREFVMWATGFPIPPEPGRPYIGTFQIQGGTLVFHVFEVIA